MESDVRIRPALPPLEPIPGLDLTSLDELVDLTPGSPLRRELDMLAQERCRAEAAAAHAHLAVGDAGRPR